MKFAGRTQHLPGFFPANIDMGFGKGILEGFLCDISRVRLKEG